MQELLAKKHDVRTIYVKGDLKNESGAISRLSRDYDALVLWQIGGNEIARSIRHRNVIFIPMYDNTGLGDEDLWERLDNVKVLSFCRAMHENFVSHGIDSLYAQYYSEIKVNSVGRQKQGIFFWQRVKEINWNTLKLLIGNHKLERVTLHVTPNMVMFEDRPTSLETIQYNIEQTHWFEDYDEYLAVLSRSKYYVAPRITEGIGLSFLEAMSSGSTVLAADRPTMNEYIEHGKTGALFDPIHPAMIDFEAIGDLSSNVLDSVSAGRKAWIEKEDEIVDFIVSDTPHRGKKSFTKHLVSRSRRSLKSAFRAAVKLLPYIIVDKLS
jgi:glycosyltransferase involved in cell wall biosynthesis